MKNQFLLSLIAATSIFFTSGITLAKDYKIGDLMISNPWARASAGPAKTGAAYIGKISNHSQNSDRLISATSPAAKRVQVHNSIVENGIAKMRHVEALNLKPGQSVALKPGGYHIMMMGLNAPLRTGQSFPLTLIFEKAGKITLTVDVRKIGSSHKMKMDHGKMKP
jgi:periplasmic copper chaperone A